jgi:hypothetical protein
MGFVTINTWKLGRDAKAARSGEAGKKSSTRETSLLSEARAFKRPKRLIDPESASSRNIVRYRTLNLAAKVYDYGSASSEDYLCRAD